MAKKPGKKYAAAFQQVETRDYPLDQAVPLLQKIKFAKFDETVEVHMRLGVDPKHADQMVRGTVVMPNGLGRSKKVLVIASGDKQREATEAGADFVGGEDIVNKIQSEGLTDFHSVQREGGGGLAAQVLACRRRKTRTRISSRCAVIWAKSRICSSPAMRS